MSYDEGRAGAIMRTVPPETRAALMTEAAPLRQKYAAMFAEAQRRQAAGQELNADTVKTLPGWSDFVADLKAIRNRHPEIASSAPSPLAVAAAAAAAAAVAALLARGHRR